MMFPQVFFLIALHNLISHCKVPITIKNLGSLPLNRGKMRCFYFFLLSVSLASSLNLTHEEYKRYWQEWKSFYGKSYKSDILDQAHFIVWKNNLEVSRFYFQRSMVV